MSSENVYYYNPSEDGIECAWCDQLLDPPEDHKEADGTGIVRCWKCGRHTAYRSRLVRVYDVSTHQTVEEADREREKHSAWLRRQEERHKT